LLRCARIDRIDRTFPVAPAHGWEGSKESAMKTRATQLKAPGKIVLAERELTVGSEEVLVKGHLSGICGSDKAMYRGDIPEKITLPLWIGHESGGTVVEVGAKVREYRPGDKVMVFNWCNTLADYYKVPVSGLQPVPDGLEMDLASLGEPISCAMYSALTCGAQLGDVVVVYGMGFAGGIIAQAVKRMGAHKVVAVDVAENKLDIARRLGSDVVVNAKAQDPVQAVRELTKGRGAAYHLVQGRRWCGRSAAQGDGGRTMMGWLALGMVLLLSALNVPIGFVLARATIVVVLIQGTAPLAAIPLMVFGGASTFPLLAIPLFILAGGADDDLGHLHAPHRW
jgi:D-arabinose 1-dehydrogenase-like Zn-dependent alcohol dehydrogenase